MDPYREPAKADIVEVDIGKVIIEVQGPSFKTEILTKYGRYYIGGYNQIHVVEFNINNFLSVIDQLGFFLFERDDNSDGTTCQIAISKHAIETIVFKKHSHKIKVDLNKKKEIS